MIHYERKLKDLLRRGHALPMLVCFLVFSTPMMAQQTGDGVTIHADARLDVLLRKKSAMVSNRPVHTNEDAYTPAANPKPETAEPENAAAGTDVPKTNNTHVKIKSKDVPVADVPGKGASTKPVRLKPAGKEAGVVAKPGVAPPSKTNVAAATGIAAAKNIAKDSRALHSGQGFRVQIYYGPDRNKAMQIQSAFSKKFPGVRTYFSYLQPTFRVKVGDYRSRAEAQAMLKEANKINSPSMIVPERVVAAGN